MVTVDSGPMHMAAALGVPVVAVFGPTDPVRVGPYGPGHTVLRDPSLGSRAGNYSKNDRTSICKITVDQVLQAVRERIP
jgi:heptosyltransferase I